VVTDFGKREIARKKSIPNHLAIRAVKTVLTIQAAKFPIKYFECDVSLDGKNDIKEFLKLPLKAQ